MNPILAAGLFIGVFCGLWTWVMGFTGWYKDPVMMRAFFAVIVIEIIGLAWGLKRTAAQGRGWASQVVAGTLMAVVGGVLIIGFSLVFTTVLFPDYFKEIDQMGRAVLEQQGKSATEIDEALKQSSAWANPMAQALAGFMGTLITGIFASAALAVVIRTRPVAPEHT